MAPKYAEPAPPTDILKALSTLTCALSVRAMQQAQNHIKENRSKRIHKLEIAVVPY